MTHHLTLTNLIPANLIPTVVDSSGHWGERSYDIYSMLLKNRIVFLGRPIDQEISNLIVAQILYLDSQSPGQPIHLYINSPGGEVYAGLAMYDAMQMVSSPVYTYAVGVTASMATAILAAGAAGHRYALPHATIHMHPTSSGMKGYTQDVQIALREHERLQTQMFHILGKHTGHTWQEIERVYERDRYMQSLEAKEFGLIDQILGNSSDVVMRLADGSMGIAGTSLAGFIEEKVPA